MMMREDGATNVINERVMSDEFARLLFKLLLLHARKIFYRPGPNRPRSIPEDSKLHPTTGSGAARDSNSVAQRIQTGICTHDLCFMSMTTRPLRQLETMIVQIL